MILTESASIVKEKVQYAIDNILGGYENSVTDGNMSEEDVPDFLELTDEVVSGLLTTDYGLGYEGGVPHSAVTCFDEDLLYKYVELKVMEAIFEEM